LAFGAVLALITLGGDPQTAYHAVLLAALYTWILRRNPRSEISNPKSQISNPKSQISNPNPKSQISNPKSKIQNLKSTPVPCCF
jgi:hypothetical protein